MEYKTYAHDYGQIFVTVFNDNAMNTHPQLKWALENLALEFQHYSDMSDFVFDEVFMSAVTMLLKNAGVNQQ